MANQIGDLFVSLGVKGSDKTIAAFVGVKQGMGEAASMALETKAAILGALYALEQMTSSAGNNGMGLLNLNTTLGVTIETLQRYRYAATLGGASTQDMDSAFKNLQGTLAEYKFTGQAPVRLSMVAGMIRDPKFLEAAFKQDFPTVIQYLQKFAQSGAPKDQIVAALSNLGMGGIAAGLMRGVFSEKNLREAPVISGKTAQSLANMKADWARVEAQFGKMSNEEVAKWGPQFIKDVRDLIPDIRHLVDSLMELAKQLHVFGLLGGIMKTIGWSANIASYAIDDFTKGHKAGDAEKTFGKDSFTAKLLEWRNSLDAKGKSLFDQGLQNLGQVPLQSTGQIFSPQTTINLNIQGPVDSNTLNHGAKMISGAVEKVMTKQNDKSTNKFVQTNQGLNQSH